VNESKQPEIKERERDAILQSLRAGVVPRIGQQYIQVGRVDELEALVDDVRRIVDGGSTFRFVIGEFGSGKTFFIMLVRAVALERRLVTVHADLSPDRRLLGSGGQARSLYAELVRNMATRAKPDGGALQSVVERFVTSAIQEAATRSVDSSVVFAERFRQIQDMVGGFDFATVIKKYWEGYEQGSEQLQSDAIRWLRGEFSRKTDARTALGVKTIVDDANWYDHLKLLAKFVRMAGYGGMLVCLDELVNLYKLNHTVSRSSNYEQLLRILNDSLQGTAGGIGWLLGGTPEFLLDPRRGLYSYPALQSRLAENNFATIDFVDRSGPVLRLANLSSEDFYVLLTKLRHVYARGDSSKYLLPNEALTAFMDHCALRVGDAYFRTPRNTIKEFINLLSILDQNPGASWQEVLGNVNVALEANPDLAPLTDDLSVSSAPPQASQDAKVRRGDREGDDDLTTFKL
jgi:hypothetical protein